MGYLDNRTVQTFTIHLTKDGQRFGHIRFERNSVNGAVFEGHTDTEALNHAISAALSSGVPLGANGHELDVKYLDPVYDTNRDLYVDPVTKVESPAARAKRLVEESRVEGY